VLQGEVTHAGVAAAFGQRFVAAEQLIGRRAMRR
jgi:hypothetical protein